MQCCCNKLCYVTLQLRSQVRPLAPLPLPGQPHLPGLRTSPTVPYATTQSHYHQSSSAAANRRNHHHQRSSISSMDSAAIVSDAGGCDEPLYSRIDHSSIDSHQHHQLVAAPSNINNNPETPTNGRIRKFPPTWPILRYSSFVLLY